MTEDALRDQIVIERFVAVCRADPRILAATRYGSRVGGSWDERSDIDLAVITSDAAFESFRAERGAFVQKLGNPLFIEDFDISDMLFVILDDGTEIELSFGREGKFSPSNGGPFHVLLDKRGILSGVEPVRPFRWICRTGRDAAPADRLVLARPVALHHCINAGNSGGRRGS
ncbi:MAG: nucleotidyltransferase domain-containing protein [Caldilineales bacterium]